MHKQASISDGTFGLALDPSNALRVFYKTNLLIPLIGPVEERRAIRYLRRIYRDVWATDSVIRGIQDHRRRYGTDITLPPIDPPVDPMQGRGPDYITDIASRVQERLRQEDFMSRSAGVWTMALPNAKKAENAPQSLGRHRPLRRSKISRKARSRGAILMGIGQDNVAMADLYRLGKMNASHKIFDSSLEVADPLPALLETLGASIAPQQARLAARRPLFDQAVAGLDEREGTGLQARLRASPRLGQLLHAYGLAKLDQLSRWQIQDADPAREWAMQRHEELRLHLGSPVLRGPIRASAVSPRSKRTTTQTQTAVLEESFGQSTRDSTRATTSTVLVTASAFESRLDNMTDSGISSESAFSSETTLLETLKQERRAMVEAVGREISKEIETSTSTSVRRTSGFSDEYMTEGKDPKLATTELEYQVVVPVAASVHLRDVGAVWCPRIDSPFRALHAHIIDYEQQMYAAYLTQHYTTVPVRPVIKTQQLTSEVFKVQLNGTRRINTRWVDLHLEYHDPYARIDVDAIEVRHENGRSGDFDHGERWNWDDLENASVRMINKQVNGHSLGGLLVLETTDPERFNKSFIYITVPVITYTPETVAALAEYEQQLQERELKQQMIRSRAAQYAAMKRDELIASFEDPHRLREEAFKALIRQVFEDAEPEKHSYYEEVIRRCINWAEASIQFESQPLPHLLFKHLPPAHFMNCPGIRFFLPLYDRAADTLFDVIQRGGTAYFRGSATKVKGFLAQYKARLAQYAAGPNGRMLDEFTTEIQIGRHLEAVLSQYDFTRG